MLLVFLQQRLEARVVAEGPCHSGRCAGDGGSASFSTSAMGTAGGLPHQV
jgi:hypothetical protein